MDDDGFVARRSTHVSGLQVKADGDTWQETLAVCSNVNSGKLFIRSYFTNRRTGQREWDEPPSGASRVITATDDMRRTAKIQLKTVKNGGTVMPEEDEQQQQLESNSTKNETKKSGGKFRIFGKKTIASTEENKPAVEEIKQDSHREDYDHIHERDNRVNQDKRSALTKRGGSARGSYRPTRSTKNILNREFHAAMAQSVLDEARKSSGYINQRDRSQDSPQSKYENTKRDRKSGSSSRSPTRQQEEMMQRTTSKKEYSKNGRRVPPSESPTRTNTSSPPKSSGGDISDDDDFDDVSVIHHEIAFTEEEALALAIKLSLAEHGAENGQERKQQSSSNEAASSKKPKTKRRTSLSNVHPQQEEEESNLQKKSELISSPSKRKDIRSMTKDEQIQLATSQSKLEIENEKTTDVKVKASAASDEQGREALQQAVRLEKQEGSTRQKKSEPKRKTRRRKSLSDAPPQQESREKQPKPDMIASQRGVRNMTEEEQIQLAMSQSKLEVENGNKKTDAKAKTATSAEEREKEASLQEVNLQQQEKSMERKKAGPKTPPSRKKDITKMTEAEQILLAMRQSKLEVENKKKEADVKARISSSSAGIKMKQEMHQTIKLPRQKETKMHQKKTDPKSPPLRGENVTNMTKAGQIHLAMSQSKLEMHNEKKKADTKVLAETKPRKETAKIQKLGLESLSREDGARPRMMEERQIRVAMSKLGIKSNASPQKEDFKARRRKSESKSQLWGKDIREMTEEEQIYLAMNQSKLEVENGNNEKRKTSRQLSEENTKSQQPPSRQHQGQTIPRRQSERAASKSNAPRHKDIEAMSEEEQLYVALSQSKREIQAQEQAQAQTKERKVAIKRKKKLSEMTEAEQIRVAMHESMRSIDPSDL